MLDKESSRKQKLEECNAEQQTTKVIPGDTILQSPTHDNSVPATLKTKQQLSDFRVEEQVTSLIIGDAVLHPVQPAWVFPKGTCQKLTIPNLTLANLVHWLKNIPHFSHIQNVIVHVGINTCWENAITKNQWCHLLKLLKSVFPSAKLFMSAIILPSGQHPLLKTAAVSNDALADICKEEGAVFVSHTATFRSFSGAPKKSMYRDSLYPSKKGLGRLTNHMMRTINPNEKLQNQSPQELRQQALYHQPFSYTGTSRRRVLLPTPNTFPSTHTSNHLHNQNYQLHNKEQRHRPVCEFSFGNPHHTQANPAPFFTSYTTFTNTNQSNGPRFRPSGYIYQPVHQRRLPSYSDVAQGRKNMITHKPTFLETYV